MDLAGCSTFHYWPPNWWHSLYLIDRPDRGKNDKNWQSSIKELLERDGDKSVSMNTIRNILCLSRFRVRFILNIIL